MAVQDLGMVKAGEDLKFAVVIPAEKEERATMKQVSSEIADNDQEKALTKIYNNLVRLAAQSN